MHIKQSFTTSLFTLLLLLPSSILFAQPLDIDFESSITTSDFIDFDGGTATVLPNPQSSGINTSATVARIVRDGGENFAGSKIVWPSNLDFTTLNSITMKIFTTAPVGTVLKLKLEGNGAAERDVNTTVSGEWEELRWDFTGTPTEFNTIAFMFDFGTVGDGSASSTFLFDDVQQIFGGTQIDVPVSFEGSTVNYTTTDFGGTVSSLVADPTDPSNTVIKVIKTDSAATWAGTTIGTPAGFATNLPFSLTESEMTVRVWSPDANIPVRLKVEDSNDPTHTCETQVNTTVAGAWETLTFDFLNQAPGTELLSVGLSRGWVYNMASIFFNFDTDGATAGEKTYYFDNVAFGEFVMGVSLPAIQGLDVFPNPTQDQWSFSAAGSNITSIEIYDLRGSLLSSPTPSGSRTIVDASDFAPGIYIARVSTRSAQSTLRLVKQ